MRLIILRFCMVLMAALLLAQGGAASAAEGLVVVAEAQGSAVSVDIRATVTAPHAVVWSTLTDYGHLSEFIPGMQSSKITERRGQTAIVEQRGEAGFLIFSYGIDVVVASTEHHPDSIEIRVLKGNLKRLDGRYQVERGEKEGTWTVRWVGLIEPSLSLPQFLNVRLIRGSLVDQFRGLIDEIERRDVVRRTALSKGN
jgi:ribosome-associated toxin RatA of RatAB toxin-antitoxin module